MSQVYTSKFTNLYYGTWQMSPDDKPKTAMKLVCEGLEERVVGLHVIGMGADEMLQVWLGNMLLNCMIAGLGWRLQLLSSVYCR